MRIRRIHFVRALAGIATLALLGGLFVWHGTTRVVLLRFDTGELIELRTLGGVVLESRVMRSAVPPCLRGTSLPVRTGGPSQMEFYTVPWFGGPVTPSCYGIRLLTELQHWIADTEIREFQDHPLPRQELLDFWLEAQRLAVARESLSPLFDKLPPR